MARPKTYAKIRIETLEGKVAWYRARKNYEAEQAIRDLARASMVTLNEANVQKRYEEYCTYLKGVTSGV